MQPDVDFEKIGQRIKDARIAKRMTQAELGTLVGCSNNHLSHVETGQTKISLTMLLKMTSVLEKDLSYFVLETSYAPREQIIDEEIAQKLKGCKSVTLRAISEMIDVLLKQQMSLSGKD